MPYLKRKTIPASTRSTKSKKPTDQETIGRLKERIKGYKKEINGFKNGGKTPLPPGFTNPDPGMGVMPPGGYLDSDPGFFRAPGKIEGQLPEFGIPEFRQERIGQIPGGTPDYRRKRPQGSALARSYYGRLSGEARELVQSTPLGQPVAVSPLESARTARNIRGYARSTGRTATTLQGSALGRQNYMGSLGQMRRRYLEDLGRQRPFRR